MSRVRQSQLVLQNLLDLLFPPHCVICKQNGSVLCPLCLAKIRPHRPLLPKLYSLHISGLQAVNMYQEPLRTCIHALKYDGITRLAEPLGLLLAQAYISYQMQADMLIPVPLHSERQQQRGYNHAQLLAQACTGYIHVPVRDDVLVRVRATAAQVGLGAFERQHNMAGAFCCTKAFATGNLYGRRIVLVDDVCTTGATLEACAAPLFAAGAHSVWALVLARTL